MSNKQFSIFLEILLLIIAFTVISRRMTALDERTFRNFSTKTTMIEERGRLISSLVDKDLGFREEEEFVLREGSKFRGVGNLKRAKKLYHC